MEEMAFLRKRRQSHQATADERFSRHQDANEMSKPRTLTHHPIVVQPLVLATLITDIRS